MSLETVVNQWLHQHSSLPPDALRPADEFPLATISNPPSSSSLFGDDNDDDGHSSRPDVAKLIHPPTPIMGEDPVTNTNHARRRSASLAGVAGGTTSTGKKHRKHRSTGIGEVNKAISEDGHSDSSGKTESEDLELDDMDSDGRFEDDEETGLTGNDRRRRRRRKRRNTLLDQRVVEDVQFTKEEEKLANQSLIHSMLINGVLILLWYLFSISISVYNKWMFKQDKGDGKTEHIFPYPLFTTCLHMVVQFTLASLVLFFIPSLRPRHDSINPHAAQEENYDSKKPLMTKWFYLTRIGPCGAATGMDIGLGNTSLRFISLTFFTMCKSSALGFVLFFAFLFRLEQPSWRLVFIIVVMTLGVVMMVAGEAAFHTLGFILVMCSACSSGFRWSLTQILLLRNPATSNPFSSIFFLAPVMFLSLIILAIPVEGFAAVSEGLSKLFETNGHLLGIGMLLFPGCLAFLMTASEFALLKRTSVVTLSICGIFKEVVTISTANLVFNDPLTPINISGLIITIGSIAAYNYMKIKKMREEARVEAHLATTEGYAPVLPVDDDSGRTSIAGARPEDRIRSSLSLRTGLPAHTPPQNSPLRASPVKRPEDLD
ncbi:TPT-domain-containing protein [Delitschia confertaspora ATCC 74209]|uniref:TPT-domain-containing protein n=1 Tax=Delitschia confertaspora ATCC 74209 TaxID=1513339 RepID=A0A9P4JQ11_9PLEO|nr:TPT-domain-containing protein [Delitschia confertaspora ATCC 74209]